MVTDAEALIEQAAKLADDVLFPAAIEVDRGPGVPDKQLQHLADAGFYGITSEDRPGGPPADWPVVARVIEELASGCLTTAFVWAQHLGAARAASTSTGPVRQEMSAKLASGALRGGVAFAHILRPGTPMTTAEPSGDDWIVNGAAPWVTGWGHIDLVHAAFRHGPDIVWALLDARDSNTLVSHRLDLTAVQASDTVVLEYDDHLVPIERVTAVQNYDEWKQGYALGLRGNGSLPLGVASRCVRLLSDIDEGVGASFGEQLTDVRNALDTSAPEDMPEARAAAAHFSAVLVASTGGRAVTLGEHAQRLAREALFLLVQGQTPQIRAGLQERFLNG